MAEETSPYQVQQLYQGLVATIAGPCHGPVQVPVSVHEPTGLKYITMNSIQAMYPEMIGLEIEGVRISPNLGFNFSGPKGISQLQVEADTTLENSEDMVADGIGQGNASLEYEFLAEEKVDKELAIVARQLGFNNLFQRDIRSDPSDFIEWVRYCPEKPISVLHDCSLHGQQKRSTDSNISDSAGVKESVWCQFRNEMKEFIIEQNQSLLQEIKEFSTTHVTSLQGQQTDRSGCAGLADPEVPSARTKLESKNMSTRTEQPINGIPTISCSRKHPLPSQDRTWKLNRSRKTPPKEAGCSSNFAKERLCEPSEARRKPNDWPKQGPLHIVRSDQDRVRDRGDRLDNHLDKGVKRMNSSVAQPQGQIHNRDGNGIEKGRTYIPSPKSRPYGFQESELVKFVKDCKGTIVRDTMAVAISLRSSDEALSLYRFLAYRDYRGRYLKIKLEWDWGRSDMEDLVSAIEKSSIQSLSLNCSQGDGNQPSRYYPLVNLLRIRTLTDLRLNAISEILRGPNVRAPSNMSHLSTLNIQVGANMQCNRFIDVIKRATNLRQLILDSPPDRYRDFLELVKLSMVRDRSRSEYRQQSGGIPTSINVQFNYLEYVTLMVKIDRVSGELNEFSLDLNGTQKDLIQWKPIFLSKALVPLASMTALGLKGMGDSDWASFLLRLAKTNEDHRDDQKRMKLQDLRVDCKELAPLQLRDMCDLIRHTGSSLLSLKLTNMIFPAVVANGGKLPMLDGNEYREDGELSPNKGSEIINWSYFFKSLRFSVLERLHIEGANLGDADITTLVTCLENMASWDQRCGLNRLALLNTTVTARGMKDLISAAEKNRWNIKIDIRDI
ncbi:hypothetical protein BGX27_004702 [Mortierella sp. AM989]|nr:hypothetical protein BGX27_004702 [Mortierella sp. AM989]